ncbi:hypothetical protein EUGRSUZ_J00181 [Eucalyptus grandis]|uniref:Uncharacterized protein n=2 Tax=Eucalyptus grandis TaxID=71139 RepID=A0ACC3J1F3_EUCGR|nr:hypothetical protein EUGRSUZ_J00181 [Eucalyptus grandis]
MKREVSVLAVTQKKENALLLLRVKERERLEQLELTMGTVHQWQFCSTFIIRPVTLGWPRKTSNFRGTYLNLKDQRITTVHTSTMKTVQKKKII